MKKYLCMIIPLLIVLSLFGCVSNDVLHTEIKTTNTLSMEMIAVEAGDSFSFAIDANNNLWAWGDNSAGQIGDGTLTEFEERSHSHEPWIISVDNNRHRPIKVMESVASVSAGFNHTMAITTDGSLWAWGSGLLGDGTIGSNHTPVKIMDDVASVSAGFGYTLVIKTDGSLWAWGMNTSGQLGDGTGGHGRYSKNTPVKIMDDVVYVSTGFSHSMAITADGNLWAWGWNNNGQIGDGTRRGDRHSPVIIMGDVASVSAGTYHTMAITTDGSLWGWGANWNGELGDGTVDTRKWNEDEGFWFFENRPTPTKIMDSVAAVSVSHSHTMAIMKDGSLWAWGDGYGASPAKIMDSVTMVSTGLHTIVLDADGSVWTWGRNRFGELGDGTTSDRSFPVRIIYSAKLSE